MDSNSIEALPEAYLKIATQIRDAFQNPNLNTIIRERLGAHLRVILPAKALFDLLEEDGRELLISNTKVFFDLCNVVFQQYFFQYINPVLARQPGPIQIRLAGWPNPTVLHRIRVSDLNRLGGFTCQIIARTRNDPKINRVIVNCSSCYKPTPISPETAASFKTIKCSCGNKCETKNPNNTIEYEDCVRLVIDTLPEYQGTQSSSQYLAVLTKDMCKQNVLDEIEVGCKAVITGILRAMPTMEGKASTFYIEANYVENLDKHKETTELSEEDKVRIAEIQSSTDVPARIAQDLFGPFIGGLDSLKRALVLSLVGGVIREGGRGTINVLMTGEPSTAKSYLLKLVKKMRLHNRIVYATGSHSSVVGLTAGILQDEVIGTKVLVPGSLALANNGICLIDEFDKFPKDEQDMMNDAIEQGELQINKVLKGKFETKTAVIMACNPVGGGKFDVFKKDFISQVDIIPSLLSRFDFIFLLEHLKGDQRRNVAKKISARRARAEPAMLSEEQEKTSLFYRKYFGMARTFQPTTNAELDDYIADMDAELVKMENPDGNHTITFRHTEALCRIAEAHARLSFRKEVTKQDVKYAHDVLAENLTSIGHNPKTGTFDLTNVETGRTSETKNALAKMRDILFRIGVGNSISYDDLWIIVQEQIPEWTNTKFNEIVHKLNYAGDLVEYKQGVYTIR